MIAIVDYKAGNLTSVYRALNAVGVESEVTADPDVVRAAERVIFPGVGAAGATMSVLTETGLGRAIADVAEQGKPLLGICIACQVILEHSEENDADCLGLLPGQVKAFTRDMTDQNGDRLKSPHMGWNGIDFVKDHFLFKDVAPGSEFYFVHGYYPAPSNQDDVYGTTDYGITFPSIIGRGNIMALQFHAEKSGRAGLSILKNFARWRP